MVEDRYSYYHQKNFAALNVSAGRCSTSYGARTRVHVLYGRHSPTHFPRSQN